MNGSFRIAGRTREIAEVLGHWEAAELGAGRALVITGAPGIGKTHLAQAVAIRTAARGARVVWGRAWEFGGAPAYWPLYEALAQLGDEALLLTATRAIDPADARAAYLARGKLFYGVARGLAA